MDKTEKNELKKKILIVQLTDLPLTTENMNLVNRYFISEVKNHYWSNTEKIVNDRLERGLTPAYYKMVNLLIDTINMSFFEYKMCEWNNKIEEMKK